jgi:hypothetical protein
MHWLLVGIVTAVIQDDVRRVFIARLRRAIELAGMTELQHCQAVNLKQSHWSDQCAARQPLSGEALIRLDEEAQRWHAVLTLQALGFPKEIRRAMRVELAVRAAKTMAKMLRAQEHTAEERRHA